MNPRADLHSLLRAFCWARLAVAAFVLGLGPWAPAVLVSVTSRGALVTASILVVTPSVAVLLGRRPPRPQVLAWLFCLLDSALITAVVAATGGVRSILVFLYVLLVTAACVLLSRWGAVAVALLSSALYTVVILARAIVPALAFDAPVDRTVALDVLAILVTSGTLTTVSLVAGGLAERFLRSERDLESERRSAATLGRMAANIAHELRNPLAALSGAAEALAGADVTPATRARLSEVVIRESRRLSELIENFILYARPAPLALEPVDAARVVEDVVGTLREQAAPGDLKIVCACSGSLPLTADRERLRQAVWTLCVNALGVMPAGGELRVEGQRRAGMIELAVTDTGEPIPPQNLPHAFEPFFPARRDTTGLGYALVDRIAREHGGEVRVRSEAGLGAEFTLRLPEHHA